MFEIVFECRNKGSDYWVFLDQLKCSDIYISSLMRRKLNYEIDNPNKEIRFTVQDAKLEVKDAKVEIEFIEKRKTKIVLEISKESIEKMIDKNSKTTKDDCDSIAEDIATNLLDEMSSEELMEHTKDQFSEFDIISTRVID